MKPAALPDFLIFARGLIAAPDRVAAISPSSRFLARAMAASLGPHTGQVVEFGPGTGQLTPGILDAGVAAENLTLFGLNADFARLRRQRFPGVAVHQASAQDAARQGRAGSMGAVVSAWLPQRLQDAAP